MSGSAEEEYDALLKKYDNIRAEIFKLGKKSLSSKPNQKAYKLLQMDYDHMFMDESRYAKNHGLNPYKVHLKLKDDLDKLNDIRSANYEKEEDEKKAKKEAREAKKKAKEEKNVGEESVVSLIQKTTK